MRYFERSQRQRGEVASLLTIVSMVVLSIGLLVGYQINRNSATINPAPQAAGPTTTSPIPAEGVDRHDQVCFPGGDKNQQVRDKYCRTRMYPALLTRDIIKTADARAKQIFNQIFQGTEQSKQNPLIVAVTAKDQRTLQIYGGLCLNRSSVAGNGRLSTEDVEVYISLFGVRKFYDDKGQVGIEENDINDVLRYKIAAAEDKAASNNTDELFVARARDEVCTFTNGKVDATDYRKTDNPLLFNIQAAKASIKSAIERAKQDPTIHQKFDEEACEVYIHLRDNITAGDKAKPKDTYNIFKINLRDVLGEDEAKDLCNPNVTPTPTTGQGGSPTPSVPVTVTPLVSPTPTGPLSGTPSVTPPVAQCYQRCTPITKCDVDPATGKRMLCLNVDGFNILPPTFPTTAKNTDGANNVLSICQNGDVDCLCLPQRCQANPGSCESPDLACPNVKVSPTPTNPLVSITPAKTVTPPPPTITTTTGTPQACSFDALAYVQECLEIDATGQCKRAGNGRFQAKAIQANVLNGWGASNNKQIAGGRYGTSPATPFQYQTNTFVGAFDGLKVRFPYLSTLQFSEMSFLDYQASVPIPAGKNPLDPGSAADLTPEGRAKNPILIAPVHQFPNEQYFNRENASVRLYANFASKEYRVVPDGNEIAYCNNALMGTAIGACNLASFQSSRFDNTVDPASRDPRDTIDGLTVGCGQNIVYGWTLQKCNTEPADYIFVIDTSSSMTTGKDASGQLKIDAAKKALRTFLTNIKTYGKDSRAALVQFSSTANTATVQDLTTNIDSVLGAVDTKLRYQSGTCIEDGLRETISLLKRNGTARKTHVVFLTDGMPNCPEGNPNPGSEDVIIKLGTEIKAIPNTTVYGIGVGDPTKTGVNADAEILRVIQHFTSTPDLAFSTTSEVSIEEIYNSIEVSLNSCARSDALYANFVSSQDINGDGVINTIDLFLIYDNYFARGQDVPEDLNNDQIVNSLDVSIIVNSMGKVVPQENNTAQKVIGDVFN
jgi:hypothetical protein